MNACESLRAMCQTDTEKLPPLPMDKHNTIQVGGGEWWVYGDCEVVESPIWGRSGCHSCIKVRFLH